MVFRIGEKKADDSHQSINMPVPLLPPPPSPSSFKKYKDASDDAGSSSSETEDENDPLAMFRTKSSDTAKQGSNLITDWEEEPGQAKTMDETERVCLVSVRVVVSSVVPMSSRSVFVIFTLAFPRD